MFVIRHKESGKLVMVVCQQCGYRTRVEMALVWPIVCRYCNGDAAPSWWFREKTVEALHPEVTP